MTIMIYYLPVKLQSAVHGSHVFNVMAVDCPIFEVALFSNSSKESNKTKPSSSRLAHFFNTNRLLGSYCFLSFSEDCLKTQISSSST